MNPSLQEIQARIQDESSFIEVLKKTIHEIIIGQDELLDRMLVALFARGHILLEGVPGLAKTLMVKTLAEAVQTRFQRIQFTPDLLPADLLGTLIYNQQTASFITRKGPIFAHFILADEINRSPAKVQSALLEAMQERQVTIGDTTFPLEEPFMVLATQNPIEQEGTYPLPEAQVDRFMMKVKLTYPRRDDELAIIRRMAYTQADLHVRPVISHSDILRVRQLVDQIHIDEKIEHYIIDLVMATRTPEDYQLPNLQPLIQFGASPRASINLVLASKAFAFLNRRGYVLPEDVRAIIKDVLRHRIILTYEAEAEEITSEDIIQQIINKIEVP